MPPPCATPSTAPGADGIVPAKPDGSAKGGAFLRIRKEPVLPKGFVRSGEKVGHLEPFDPGKFLDGILAAPTPSPPPPLPSPNLRR
ncbi:MAG: hypothetical protein JW929_00685 [Anaerolineales bacterium]|nr:hypothetical protein [Anaerolineales bacterium]